MNPHTVLNAVLASAAGKVNRAGQGDPAVCCSTVQGLLIPGYAPDQVMACMHPSASLINIMPPLDSVTQHSVHRPCQTVVSLFVRRCLSMCGPEISILLLLFGVQVTKPVDSLWMGQEAMRKQVGKDPETVTHQ